MGESNNLREKQVVLFFIGREEGLLTLTFPITPERRKRKKKNPGLYLSWRLQSG